VPSCARLGKLDGHTAWELVCEYCGQGGPRLRGNPHLWSRDCPGSDLQEERRICGCSEARLRAVLEARPQLQTEEEQATQNVVTGYLIGGVIGVLIASSENEQANTDPKSTFRRQLHDECMVKRGYRKAE